MTQEQGHHIKVLYVDFTHYVTQLSSRLTIILLPQCPRSAEITGMSHYAQLCKNELPPPSPLSDYMAIP